MLNSFKRDYLCPRTPTQVGEEYKIYNIRHDPFYGPRADDYEKIRLYSSTSPGFDNFSHKIARELELVAMYFMGEFTETTNKEFMDIWPEFFKAFYFGHVFICYSEEVLKAEKDSGRGRVDIDPDRCRGDCKFRLFKKVSQVDEFTAVYSSLYTGLNYEIDVRDTPLTRASFNEGLAYMGGRDLLEEYIATEQMFIQSQKLAQKRLMRTQRDNLKANSEDLSLREMSPIFNVISDDAMKNKYELFDIMPPEGVKTILDTLLGGYQYKSAKLGYVHNMNDKKERLTTGENFKDLHGVTNVQHVILSSLNTFARIFNSKNPGISLNFNLSNWGEAQGIPKMEEMEDSDLDNKPDTEEIRE